jgi:hypothetical protein
MGFWSEILRTLRHAKFLPPKFRLNSHPLSKPWVALLTATPSGNCHPGISDTHSRHGLIQLHPLVSLELATGSEALQMNGFSHCSSLTAVTIPAPSSWLQSFADPERLETADYQLPMALFNNNCWFSTFSKSNDCLHSRLRATH